MFVWRFVRLLLVNIFNFGKDVRLTVCNLSKFSILASMFVWRFVTCQNLHFGKYVRLTVCYLPKFSILASMFVWRFVTCQNFEEIGKYVRLTVCLFVTCQRINILASMLVGHVCYLPKLPFWQVCWLVVFVCLCVSLSVCLYENFTKSQERLSQSAPNLVISKH